MTYMRKTRITIVAILVLSMKLYGTTAVSAACTGVYVGPEASSDGTMMLARCNDLQGTNSSRVNVVERVEDEPGRTMPVDMEGTVQAEIPDDHILFKDHLPVITADRSDGLHIGLSDRK